MKNTKIKNSLLKLFMRFASVGMVSGLLYVAAVAFLVEIMALEAVWASVLGYAIAIPVSFFGHRNITFRSDGQVSGEFLRFFLVHVCGLTVSFFSMNLATQILGLSYWVGMISVVLLVALISFVIMNSWVFMSSNND